MTFPLANYRAAIGVGLVSMLVPITGTILRAAESADPTAELASFQVAAGFEVNLFASEKEGVIKPIQIRFDGRGRLWVVGSTIYPLIEPGQPPNDKVLILEDTDGDGRADKTTVFADGLMIPTGIELGDGGAYIGHGTELLFLKDRDGDGKADERRVVLRGFGTGDNHQNINSFRWGPGGELWMCQGLHTHSHVETPWGIVNVEQAGLWRFRPRLKKLDGFFGSEHEPQNPWGYVFTEWGEPIVLAGNNSSPIYPVPGLVRNRRQEASPLIWPTGRGRKVSGGEFIGTSHFPDAWQGALVLGGYINNAVWAVKAVDDGSGFRLDDLPPLLTSTNRSFRPVDVRFGPDGALYICDWYNPIIGHYQASFRHPDRDKTHGRIWRVTAKGRPLTKQPQLSVASIDEILEQLKSNDRWTRQFAKRELADRPSADILPALRRWVKQPGLSELALVEALGVFQSHELPEPELLARVCRSKERGARAYAASVVGAWADRLDDPLRFLRPLAGDSDPRVRLHAIVACTYVPKAEAMEVAAVAADFSTDKFLDYALRQTVFALKPFWLTAFQAGTLNLENKLSRLSSLVRADGTADTLSAVRQLWRSAPEGSNTREMFIRILLETGTATDLADVMKISDSATQLRVFPALRQSSAARGIRPEGDITALLNPIVAHSNSTVVGEGLKLAGLWKVETFRTKAQRLAKDESATISLRQDAIEAVALFADDASRIILVSLAENPTATLRVAAIAAMVAFDLKRAADHAAVYLSGEEVAEAEVTEILTAFLHRSGGMTALTKSLLARSPSAFAARLALPLFSASGQNLPEFAGILHAAAGATSRNKTMSAAELTEFVREVRASGDAVHGAEVFRRPELGCVACHAVNGVGGRIGPELSAVGSAQPIDFIVGAILDPQKEVKEGFTATSIATKEGEEFQGYIVRETAGEVVLRDVLQNKEIRIARPQISQRRSVGSVMPVGLADTLSQSDFRDLVRYLSELGQSR